MNVAIYYRPVPHVVIDGFLNDFDTISDMAKGIVDLADTGNHGGHAYQGLKRLEVYLYANYHDQRAQALIERINAEFWSEEKRRLYDTLPYPFCMIGHTSFSDLLLGFYGNSDRYALHDDTDFVTGVMYLHKEVNFYGGEFVLTNQTRSWNFRQEEKITIPSLPNRAILFPACYRHGVTQTLMKEHKVDNMRIALSHFIGYKHEKQ